MNKPTTAEALEFRAQARSPANILKNATDKWKATLSQASLLSSARPVAIAEIERQASDAGVSRFHWDREVPQRPIDIRTK
jgi:hypothetical protein